MNERLNQLMHQAMRQALTNACAKGKTEYPENNAIWNEFPEVFAELIIAKCIDEAGAPGDGLIKGDTWHDGVRASVWSIKEYFGRK